MKPKEFIKAWNDPNFELIKIPEKELERFRNLSPNTFDFLTIAGLPVSFGELNFDYLREPILTVKEMWNLEESVFDNFICIGFNGSGDPIAINLKDHDSIVYLNHDNNFEEIFINSNINLFADSIIALEKFYAKIYELNPSSMFSTEFSDSDYEEVTNDLQRIDKTIFNTSRFSHWKSQLEYELWEREEERKKYGLGSQSENAPR